MTLLDEPPTPDGPIALLLERRSNAALTDPAPTDAQLDLILRAAATVPDHGNLVPWRLIVVRGEGRERFADALARSIVAARPEAGPDAGAGVRKKAFAAPMQVLIVASPVVGAKVAEWEQLATASCTGMAMVLAAHALGVGAIWKSVPFTRGAGLEDALGLTPDEQLLGWVNLGTESAAAPERVRPEPSTYATVLDERGARPWA